MTARNISAGSLADAEKAAVKALRQRLRETTDGRQAAADFPLRRGAMRSPLFRQNPSSHSFFFSTRDPDVFWTVYTPEPDATGAVRVFLDVASHVHLLVWNREGQVDRWRQALAGAPQEIQDALRRSTDGSIVFAGLDTRPAFPATASEQADDILDRIAPYGRTLRRFIRQQFLSAQMTVFTCPPPTFPRPTSVSLVPETLRRLGEYGITLSFQNMRASAMASS